MSGPLCACGCGESLNPLLAPALELRGHNLSFSEIGKRLGVSGAYVRTLTRKPPKYVKGHSAKATVWQTVICEGCGDEFRTSTTSGRTYCKRRHCTSSRLHSEAYEQFIRRLDEQEERDRAIKRESVRRERELRHQADGLLTVPANLDERRREREENIRAAQLWLRAGREPWWWPHSRRHPFDVAYEGELRELVEQQAREMKWEDWAGLRWMVQLDAPVQIRNNAANTDGFAEPRVNWLTGGDGDPADVQVRAEEMRTLDAILGDLDIGGVSRLAGYDLERLQERLREAGLVPHDVQRKERQRLRTPARHRGGGPPSTFQPIHSKRRSRRDQIALMSGKRISRKQRHATRRELRELNEW